MKLRFRIAIAGLAVIGLACPFALAHVWLEEQGVHFNANRIDFGAPPSRYALFAGHLDGDLGAWRPGTTYVNNSRYENTEPPNSNHLYQKAANLESNGGFKAALKVWRWGWTHGVGNPATLREHIDILRVLIKKPHLLGGPELLAAMDPLKGRRVLPAKDRVSAELIPFLRYQAVSQGKAADADRVREFLAIANDFPRSPVAEPSLITVPRLLLSGDNSKVEASAIELSRLALDDLARRYPHSRFRADVVGWRGRIAFLAGNYRSALVHYRRQYELSLTDNAKARAIDSIVACESELGDKIGQGLSLLEQYGVVRSPEWKSVSAAQLHAWLQLIDGADGNAFWSQLRLHPRLLAFYLDYRLEMNGPTSEILDLAAKSGVDRKRSRCQGHILARVAEAAYDLKRFSLSERYAKRALKVAHEPDDKALATYILGSVAKRDGRLTFAQRKYEAILRHYPEDHLCGGARENLALIYERKNRLGDALDIYWKLGYRFDVAYLLDARMSTSQIADYIGSHPRSPNRDLLRYSLGVRYLRDDRFGPAEGQFKLVSKAKRKLFRTILYPGQTMTDVSPEDIVQDPLKSARELGKLYRAFGRAKSKNQRAERLMRIADYYYEQRDLLLYNPALWHGGRTEMVAYSWNTAVSTKKDYQALDKHHWQHECFARTLQLCERILKQYPNAPVRYRVAYRGACAAEHLSHMSSYWRWKDQQTDIMVKAVKLMKFARQSPDVLLAHDAKKYASVFADERTEKRQAFMTEEIRKDKNKDHDARDLPWSEY